MDGDLVVLPLPDLRIITARRIVSNELNRERAFTIVELRKRADGYEQAMGLLKKNVDDERALKNQAYADMDLCLAMNGELSKKLKRRTPWAIAAKVEVVLLMAAGAFYGYQTLKP